MKDELSKLEDLKIYSETSGGLYVKNATKEVIVNTISVITNNYKTLPHSELIALCASLSANLSLFQLLSNIDDQVTLIKELYKEKEESR